MLKRSILLVVIAATFIFQTFVSGAMATSLTPEVLTLPLNESGDTVTFTQKDAKLGKKLFNSKCAVCHLAGGTKTNPNVNLSKESLSLAYPSRQSIEGMVEFLKNPMSYDGVYDISDLHPATSSADIFPYMRNVSSNDLKVMAGHILIQQKVQPYRWAGGKTKV